MPDASTPHPTPLTHLPPALDRAAVLGAGAWGSALAAALQNAGINTRLWARAPERANLVNTAHRSAALPGIALPETLMATSDLAQATRGAQLVLIAVPASATRALAERLAGQLDPGTLVLSASKGFEQETGALMTQVLDDALGVEVHTGVLTGPSFAIEVARGAPTLLTLALSALDTGHPQHRRAQRQVKALARCLSSVSIRLETTSDVIGAQIGGALKNQIAIACGMATALGLGENARAGILTRGLDDMRRLTRALGGHPETLLGSCGVGDLFLTAASRQSRNTRLGMALVTRAHDTPINELSEGAVSARTVAQLESRLSLRLELAHTVRCVLDGHQTPAQALAALLDPHRPVHEQVAPTPSVMRSVQQTPRRTLHHV